MGKYHPIRLNSAPMPRRAMPALQQSGPMGRGCQPVGLPHLGVRRGVFTPPVWKQLPGQCVLSTY